MFKSLMSNLGIQTKAVSTGRMDNPFIHTTAQSVPVPQFEDDTTFLQTYVDAVWVHASVSVVAESASQVPFKIFNMRDREKPKDVTYDDMFKFFRFPNTQMSQYRLFEATFSYLRLTGDCYWEVTGGVSNPEKIYILRPDLVEIVPDAKQGVKCYNYWPNGKNGSDKPIIFKSEEVVHFKNFNPLNEFQGLSPLNPVKLSIASDLLAQKYNITFFSNGAAPYGVFKTDQVLNPDKMAMIEEKIVRYLQRSKNWFSPLILHGGLDYKPISMGPKEVEFIQGREINRTDILSSQRATPAVLGLSTANYAEARQQAKIFRQFRVLPMLRAMQSDIDSLILQYLGPSYTSLFDTQSVEEYREDVLENELKLRTEMDRGIISVNEYRAALRMPLLDKKLGDKRFVLSSLSELTEDGVILAQPNQTGNTESPDKIKELEFEEFTELNKELLELVRG